MSSCRCGEQAAVRQLLVGLRSVADAWNRRHAAGAPQRRMEFAELRGLYPRKGDGTGPAGGGGYSLEDLCRHPAIIYLPYQVSTIVYARRHMLFGSCLQNHIFAET